MMHWCSNKKTYLTSTLPALSETFLKSLQPLKGLGNRKLYQSFYPLTVEPQTLSIFIRESIIKQQTMGDKFYWKTCPFYMFSGTTSNPPFDCLTPTDKKYLSLSHITVISLVTFRSTLCHLGPYFLACITNDFQS